MAAGKGGRLLLLSAAVFVALYGLPGGNNLAARAAVVPDEEPENNFFTKVFAAAAQGVTAATVAAVLSAVSEPIVNRLLVKRMTFSEAMSEITFELVSKFFLTTWPTNMLKFPVFEMINMALSFTALSGSVRGIVNGWLFCSIMLPVTNYRFRKSMGWEINPALLYQAYIPTVARDIVYGWARGFVGGYMASAMDPQTSFQKALAFGITVWAACIISSPCNEWRGFTLQPKERALKFSVYFKPINYARSTGIGALIMGVSLMLGMLVAPYAEILFGIAKSHMYVSIGVVVLAIGALATMK